MPTEKEIIKLLKIRHAERIGSSSVNEIKYASDIDLQEYIKTSESYNDILKIFQLKFKKAYDSHGVYIMDFKCGVSVGNMPIRWNMKTINQGYQYIGNKKVLFTDCLQQESIIKMDVIALVEGIFTEFSENYYFIFPDFNTKPFKGKDIKPYLLQDYFKYISENNRFKALKRLYSYYKKIEGKKVEKKILIDFFNSPVGLLNQQISSLKIINDVINNTFKPVNILDVKRNIKIISEQVISPYNYKLQNILQFNDLNSIQLKLHSCIRQMSSTVDDKVKIFMASQNFNIE